jgi:hypothetical protein
VFDDPVDPLVPVWFLAARRRLTGLKWRMSFSTGDQYDIDIAEDIFNVSLRRLYRYIFRYDVMSL